MRESYKKIYNKLRKISLGIVTALFVLTMQFGVMTAYANENGSGSADDEGISEEQKLDVSKCTGLREAEFIEEYDEDFDVADIEEDLDTNSILASNAASYWRSMSSRYIYYKLSENEKAAWDDLEALCIQYAESAESCSKIQTTVLLRGMSKSKVEEFTYLFYFSHPQFFFLDYSFGWTQTSEGYYPCIYVYQDFRNGAARQAAVAEFKSQIEKWSAEVNACDTVVAKEKKAIDIIANNTVYKLDAPFDQSAYSMVVKGKTVCAGYSKTFAILMNMAGVETQVVSGMADEYHAWDLVNVHGIWYNVDPTWADQNDSGEYGINYRYLNRSDSTISYNRSKDSYWMPFFNDCFYDAGSNEDEYVDPYFVENGKMYFTTNDNVECSVLCAKLVDERLTTSSPIAVVHNGKTYYNCEAVNTFWPQKFCTDETYDYLKELRGYTNEEVTWQTNESDKISLKNGLVETKKSGNAVVVAVGKEKVFAFRLKIMDHNLGHLTFEWAEDGSSCKMTGICYTNNSHVITSDCRIYKSVSKPATCISKGVTTYTADGTIRVDFKDIEDIPVDKNNHAGSIELVGAKAATVSQAGYTGDKVCSACKTVVEKGKEIPKILIGWKNIDGKWYYYNANGIMQTGWKQIGSLWYYFGTIGAMKTGWLYYNSKWYYFDNNGVMRTGWLRNSGNWYYLSADGHMKTGWAKVNGDWYYFSASGIMQTGWLSINGNWFYLDDEGVMQTGWKKISGDWYYLDTDGVMAISWQKINGKWYYFGRNGIMRTGWVKINGTRYWFSKDGHLILTV